MNPRISVVVPMYNEEMNAENAVRSLLSVMPFIAREFEILVVESGSTDRTAEIADGLAAVDPRVRVIHQINREGLGSAIRLGFANSRMDFILYIDGDEPFDPGGVSRAIPLLEQNGAVIGFRMGRRESFRRELYSRIYNQLVQALLRTNVRDVNFSMKIFRRDLLKRLDLRSNGCFYDAELVAEFRRNRVPIAELGFEYVPRRAGESSLDRPSIIVAMLWEMARYIMRRKKRIATRGSPAEISGEVEAP
jgi:glycosyltransferase involved in cell wall biosynthesis